MISYASLLIPALKNLNPRPGPEANLAEDVLVMVLNLSTVQDIKKEATLTKGRVDLRIGGTAIELKVQGSPNNVIQQLNRYAQDPNIVDIILVTTSAKLKMMPSAIEGKNLYVIYIPRL